MKTPSINNLEFAQSELSISGQLEASALDRLSDLLLAPVAAVKVPVIQYSLRGFSKKYSLPSLQLSVDAHLPTTCQRCLNAMSVQLNLDFDYLITDSEPADMDENDDLDWLEISPAMSVSALIEDELLIAFPIAPIHSADEQGECKPQAIQSGEKPNPFAALKDLIIKA